MISRLEHIGEPWQRKPGPCIPSPLTGRIWGYPDKLYDELVRLANLRPAPGAGRQAALELR
jgi:hypothetical protein